MYLFEPFPRNFSPLSSRTSTYTWRAAHLANRPHYTGGWTIDPIVAELKKSHFSSSSRVCDMMSWGYLPALCSMAANLTYNPETFYNLKACFKFRWNAVIFHGGGASQQNTAYSHMRIIKHKTKSSKCFSLSPRLNSFDRNMLKSFFYSCNRRDEKV